MPILGALIGGIGGAQAQHSGQSNTVELGRSSALERNAGRDTLADYNTLRQLAGYGPGQQDIQAGLSSTRSLADLLNQFSQGGFLPGQSDINTSQNFAQQLYNPQRVALQQNFTDQQTQANQIAARLGRGGNDPILRNKLAQEQTRQLASLGAEQGAFAAQYAQNLPLQRLGFAQQYSQVQGGLASQALANRQALLSAGQSLLQQEQNFRLNRAGRNTSITQGGGASGAFGGALAGIGTEAQIAGQVAGAASGNPSAMGAGGAPKQGQGYGA